jgi:hypothetical protein
LVWRLVRWQPDYPPVRGLVAGIARGAARRKCAVAAARRLAVDLWRLATKQTTLEKLRLMVPVELAAASTPKSKLRPHKPRIPFPAKRDWHGAGR